MKIKLYTLLLLVFLINNINLISQNDINFVVTPETNHCKNGCIDLQINGGYSPYSVVWYDATGQSILGSIGLSGNDGLEDLCNIEAGTYKVEIFDDFCGHLISEVQVNRVIENNINISTDITPPIYYTCCDGKIDITINNSQPPFNIKWYKYNYQLKNWEIVANYQDVGYDGGDYSSVCLGRYKVQVSDNHCDYLEKEFDVNPKDEIKVIANSIKNVSNCSVPENKPWVGYYNSSNDGEISIELTKPVPYTAIWSNGQIGNSINNLAPGTYTVTVTIGNGCAKLIKSFDICCCSGYNSSNDGNSYIPYCNSGGNVTELKIDDFSIIPPVSNNNNGEIIITTSGGLSGANKYLWIGPNNFTANTKNINNLGFGVYCVTVTDGCSSVQSCYELVDCSKKSISINGSITATCQGYSYGSISVNVTGAKTPIKYLWENGNITSSINLLPVGVYCITITDANGCKATNCFPVGIKSPTRVECNVFCNNYKIKEFLPLKEKFNKSDCRYTDLFCSDDVLISEKNKYVGTYQTNVDINNCKVDNYCLNNIYYNSSNGSDCNICYYSITNDKKIINCEMSYCYIYSLNRSYVKSITKEYQNVVSTGHPDDDKQGYHYYNYCDNSLKNDSYEDLKLYEYVKKGTNQYSEGDCSSFFTIGQYVDGKIGNCGFLQLTDNSNLNQNSTSNYQLFEDSISNFNSNIVKKVEGNSIDYFSIEFNSKFDGNSLIKFINDGTIIQEIEYNLKIGNNYILFDHLFNDYSNVKKLKIVISNPKNINIEDTISFNDKQNEDDNIIKVFPNPTNEVLNVILKNKDRYNLKDINIYSLVGSNIDNMSIIPTDFGFTINLQNLPSATYILKINDPINKEIIYSKLIIKI